MKNLIQNIIQNSKNETMTRKSIFNYCLVGSVKRFDISKALKELVKEGVIISKNVAGQSYDITAYELTPEYKEALRY